MRLPLLWAGASSRTELCRSCAGAVLLQLCDPSVIRGTCLDLCVRLRAAPTKILARAKLRTSRDFPPPDEERGAPRALGLAGLSRTLLHTTAAMVYTGKLAELPPVKLPLRVAWVVSGAVRTLYLCSFGLRRNVLDAPGNAVYDVFAAVSHEGTEMELQGLAALKYFPETLALLVDNEVACRFDRTSQHANITSSLLRKNPSGRWGRPRNSWAVQSCQQRNYWYQYSKVGVGFAMAARHARSKGFSYDLAVRARTDVLFTARLDLVALHLGYLQRDATLRASGEYLATEATGSCGELSEIKAALPNTQSP